ncbi:MAG: hypothetical protein ACYDAK_02105 [Candidatus Limnocylindrales bacterium]|nr:hypothetical protein [Chloroflexota bacterium]
MATKNTVASGAPAAQAEKKSHKRPWLSQEDVPSYSLEQALRVPRAIADSYAFKPTRPLNVAGAMKLSPTSGPFRSLTGAAIAYGLTIGGAFAPEIGITPLGMRVVRPTKPGDDLAAKREALLKPRVVGEFLRQYDGAALPPDQIAKNVLLERGVPAGREEDVLALIIEGADAVAFLKEINGKKYVDLAGSAAHEGPAAESARDGTMPVRAPGTAPLPDRTTANVAGVSVGPGININIEIHIAADASAETVQEIFKNMRRYVLSNDGSVDET